MDFLKTFVYLYIYIEIGILFIMNVLTESNKQQILSEYSGSTVEKLARKFSVSNERIKKILIDSGVEIRVPTKSKIDKEWDYAIELRKKYPRHNGRHYVAISKNKDKVEIDDYLNTSGALTAYIKNVLKIEVPSLYKRKKYFHDNGIQWYEQFFDIIEVVDQKKETKKCPYCDWETVDVNNRSGMFETHLLKEHGITKLQYLEEHPDDRGYFTLVNKSLDRKMETDNRKYVCCAICGKKFARLDWRHLAKHGITKSEYIAKYSWNTVSDELHENLSQHMIEINKNMKPMFTSRPELDIMSFIEGFGVKCISGDRKILNGKELDIYIPSLNFAIEYNGNFWHSDNIVDKNKHLYKTELCKKMGIKLLQIFEDEYFNKREIVYKKIEHIISMNKTLEKIPGRKCIVSEINKYQAKEFLDKYHIQGYVGSKVYLGAFYNEELVAVMAFKEDSKSNCTWELTRFASDYDYICQGVGGKLFKYFVDKYSPEKIKSFADRRWTVDECNNVYVKLGFKFDGYTKPDYRYYSQKLDRYKRFHKFNFRKQIMHKKYGFQLTMTESEMANELGLKRIWDCGLIKYVWRKK